MDTEPVRQPRRTPCAVCARHVLAMHRTGAAGYTNHGDHPRVAAGALLCGWCAEGFEAGEPPVRRPASPAELARVIDLFARLQGRQAA